MHVFTQLKLLLKKLLQDFKHTTMVLLGKICILWFTFLCSIMIANASDDDSFSPHHDATVLPSLHFHPLRTLHHHTHVPPSLQYHHTHVPPPHILPSPHHHTRVPHSPHHHTRVPPLRHHQTHMHDVTSFGVVGDGKTDNSKAFESAWKAACKTKSGHPKMIVPDGKTFLVSPAKFVGPCASPSVTFEVLGSIVAPPRLEWKTKSREWLHFEDVDGLVVVGTGQIDGKGDTWWSQSHESKSSVLPVSMQFTHCNNLHVSGIKHSNSQRNHLSISSCNKVIISHVKLIAPATSPNTDGIDISRSYNLHIRDSVIATGDDCVAINGGSNNIFISNVHCGPGHGISIGSLGRHGRHEHVHSVRVSNCTFNKTQNGARIKTWQGGSGSARNITFEDLTFIDSDNPVIIDQKYCPHNTCGHESQPDDVKISHVSYIGLRGTSASKNGVINFICSKKVPCTNILVEDVNIKSEKSNVVAECVNAHGTARDCKSPALVNCLRKKLDYVRASLHVDILLKHLRTLLNIVTLKITPF